MRFDPPLIPGTFLRRYKRFFADVRLPNGRVVTAHCANTGRMTSCQKEGWPVLLSPAADPRRRLAYTWELVHNGRCWICVNTMRANGLVSEALEAGVVGELSADFPPDGLSRVRREAAWPGGGRADFLLERAMPEGGGRAKGMPGAAGPRSCYLEVKTVTLKRRGRLQFPDAPTERGRRHLRALMETVRGGRRAVLFFLAMRSDAKLISPARDIDPEYGDLLQEAADAGVELLAYQAKITARGMRLWRPLAIEL